MQLVSQQEVKEVFRRYPAKVQKQMLFLRKLVVETASEIDGLKNLQEILKWGEPSYLTKFGSTVRMDWKEKTPDQFAVYFKCTSKLVPTFKALYSHVFQFDGNRAIVFQLNDEIPEKELKLCILMALTYHKTKHLPLLGA